MYMNLPTTNVVGELVNNEGYLVEGKTFKIVHGKVKGDITAQIARLNAKEIGPGIIVFRSGDKLYAALAPAAPAPQAMKEFQDQWANSYMKASKDFQDNWAVSYMKSQAPAVAGKDFQDDWAVSYMKAQKDFQDNWNVSYMKAQKEFQDNWNVSYMKDFQDNWNISYMKQMKDFQDNWAVGYMK